MRVDRSKMIFLALCVLMDFQRRAARGPVSPGYSARLALALLYSFSRTGNRTIYDRFWRNLSDKDLPADRLTHDRGATAMATLAYICGDVCEDEERGALWNAVMVKTGRLKGPAHGGRPPIPIKEG